MARTPIAPLPKGKSCSKCGRHFPDCEANFYRRSGGKLWASSCKECCRAHKRRAYREDPQKHRTSALRSYHRYGDRRRADMRARNRDDEYKKKRAEYNRRYRRDNREDLLERDRRRYWDNYEGRLDEAKEWRAENREHLRYYERHLRPNQERRKRDNRARNREWYRKNTDKKRAAKQKRRALEAGAPGGHTSADIKRIKRTQGHRCFWCSQRLPPDYHVDHVIPLSRGGSNGPENIVIACPGCNLSKHNKLPSEFAGMLDLWG